jgi:tetratricopeptide (TPR) repeat protein
MRHFSFSGSIPVLLAMLLAGGSADISAFAQNRAEADTASVQQANSLDTLFAELKRERDEKQAKRISERIWAKWRDSGSATANLLMQWADKAVTEKKNGLALDLLDQVVVLMPGYAEGWNRRATLNYAMGNHDKSMADISRVLALEPRHFGAISGWRPSWRLRETTNWNSRPGSRCWKSIRRTGRRRKGLASSPTSFQAAESETLSLRHP